MNRRTFEGPMDWEYQNNRGPVDMSSPFARIPQGSFMASSFNSASPSKPVKMVNPFASAGQNVPQPAPPSPSKQQFPRPPSSSIFNPPAAKQYPSASPFRNPSFTTPQKRADEIMSEYSGAEESPAMASDVSDMPCDTPEYERFDDDMAGMAITPASAVNRKLFTDGKTPGSALSSRAPGRGEVPRGKLDMIFGRRDRVRKRKRQLGDKDVGSVRSRSHARHTSDDESDDTDMSERTSGSRWPKKKSDKSHHVNGQGGDGSRGAISNLFSAIHEHPNVPLILSWWVQLTINVFLVSVFMWFVWGGISMMRADIAHASDAARSRLLAEMNACAHEYTKNRCAPKSERLPALGVVCDEWEVCMNQDPSSVMKMQVSAKNVAEIINEFVGAMSIKAWGFIISAMLAMVLASNLGFSRFREAAFVNQANVNAAAHHAFPSQPAGGHAPMLPPSQDPNQAYIWAPIGQTPRHIRREFMPDTPTDTDASPDAPRAIMAAPQTPSVRRSPSKGERGRSPTKTANRSPSKGYY